MNRILRNVLCCGAALAGLVGLVISCESVEPQVVTPSSDFSPVRLMDKKKESSAEPTEINLPQTSVKAGEEDNNSGDSNLTSEEINSSVILADQLIEDGNYGDAIDLLNKILAEDPENEEARALLEEALKKQEEQENQGAPGDIGGPSANQRPSGNEDGQTIENPADTTGGTPEEKKSLEEEAAAKKAQQAQEAADAKVRAAQDARDKNIAQARKYIDEGKYPQAITLLNTVLRSNPDDDEAKSLLEDAKAGQQKAAEEAAAKAREDKLAQARKYIDEGKYAQAVTLLNTLLKADPDDAEAQALLDEAKAKQQAAAEEAAALKARQAEEAAEAKAKAQQEAAEARAKAAQDARDKNIAQAKKYIDEGKYAQAITLLNTVLRSNPDDAEAKSLLEDAKAKQQKAAEEAAAKARAEKLEQARKYIDEGKYPQAITLLNTLLKADPDDAEAQALLDEAKAKQQKAAEEAAAKAREDKLAQARKYIDEGKYAQAVTLLNTLLKADPDDAEAQALLDEAKAKQQAAAEEAAALKARQAEEAAEAKAKAQQEAAEARAKAAQDARDKNIAQAKKYIDEGKYAQAITLLNTVLRSNPDDAEAKSLLEDAKAKQQKAAEEAAAKARAEKLEQARKYIDEGKYPQAITLLNTLLKADPDDAEAQALLDEAKAKQQAAAEEAAKEKAVAQAESLINQGKYDQAVSTLENLRKTYPDDSEIASLLKTAQAKKDAEDAAKAAEKAKQEAAAKAAEQEAAAQKAAEDARQKRIAQAKAYMNEGKYANATNLLNALLKADPNDKEAQELLNQIKELQKKAEQEAIDEAARAREQKLEQAREYIKNGKLDLALSTLNGILKTNPDDAEAKALVEEVKNLKAKEAEEAAAKARQARLDQARKFIDEKKYTNAINVLNGLLKTNPNDAEAKALLEEAQSKKKIEDDENAAKARAAKLDQARKNIDEGKYANAINVLNGLLKTNPNDAEAKALLEEAKAKQQKANEEAAAKAREAKLAQAKTNIEQGKYANAISILNGLLKTDPNDSQAKALLEEAKAKQQKANEEAAAKAREAKLAQAKTNIEQGKYANAISILNGLLKTDPNDAEAKALLEQAQKLKEEADAAAKEKAGKLAQAQALINKGDYEGAQAILDDILKDNPGDAQASRLANTAEQKKAAAAQEARKAEEAQKKREEETARKTAAEAEAQKAVVMEELKKFTTDWVSPSFSDIEDCGYFYTSPEFGQFDMIEGEFSKKSGYAKSAYGFVFGYTKPSPIGELYNYIRFEINTDGEYALYKWDGKTYTDLVEPNSEGTAYFYKNNAINRGYNSVNKLKIRVVDGKYNVYINDKLIKSGIDFIPNGTYGVMGFFSVGKVNQEDMPNTPVVVSYRITDAELHRAK